MQPQPDGTWQVEPIDGPGNIIVYRACFRPFRTGAWMLRVATTSTLDNYVAKIADFEATFGPICWHIIYAACVQARKYQLERIRRDLAYDINRGLPVEFDPAMSWEYALRHLLKDITFWQDHVVLPCQSLLRDAPRAAGHGAMVGNATDVHLTKQLRALVTEVNTLKRTRPHDAPQQPQAQNQQKNTGSMRTHDNSTPPKELCKNYGNGGCKATTGGSITCPVNLARVHLCPLCLGRHMRKGCQQDGAPAPKAGGAGRGKKRR